MFFQVEHENFHVEKHVEKYTNMIVLEGLEGSFPCVDPLG